MKGGLIALPLIGSALSFQAFWIERQRSHHERITHNDVPVARLFGMAAALDLSNGFFGLVEAAVLWNHQRSGDGVEEGRSGSVMSSLCEALEWVEADPALVYAGPALAASATAFAIAAEVLAQTRTSGKNTS